MVKYINFIVCQRGVHVDVRGGVIRGTGSRGRRRRHVGGVGVDFFTGVSRRFQAPLAVVSKPIRRLYRDRDVGGRSGLLLGVVGQDISEVLELIGRLLSFGGLRGSALHLRIGRASVVARVGHVVSLFVIGARRGNVALGYRKLRNSCLVLLSSSGLRGVVGGLVSGTVGFAPHNNGVSMSFSANAAGGKMRFVAVAITSANGKVPRGRIRGVFGQCCRLGGRSANAVG